MPENPIPAFAAAAASEALKASKVQPKEPAPALPPVPGGGSWRPNAAGDGWVENLPAATPIELPISTIQPE